MLALNTSLIQPGYVCPHFSAPCVSRVASFTLYPPLRRPQSLEHQRSSFPTPDPHPGATSLDSHRPYNPRPNLLWCLLSYLWLGFSERPESVHKAILWPLPYPSEAAPSSLPILLGGSTLPHLAQSGIGAWQVLFDCLFPPALASLDLGLCGPAGAWAQGKERTGLRGV